jgi:hypothetical protein
MISGKENQNANLFERKFLSRIKFKDFVFTMDACPVDLQVLVLTITTTDPGSPQSTQRTQRVIVWKSHEYPILCDLGVLGGEMMTTRFTAEPQRAQGKVFVCREILTNKNILP